MSQGVPGVVDMPGQIFAPGDYSGSGLASLASLEKHVGNTYTLHIADETFKTFKAMTFKAGGKILVSGCDFDGDRKSDFIVVPATTLMKTQVISVTPEGARTQNLSLVGKALEGTMPTWDIVAASCFDTTADGKAELLLITSRFVKVKTRKSSSSKVASVKKGRFIRSLLVINQRGEVVSETSLRGQPNGLLPIPLDRGGAPIIGYYNKKPSGIINRISFVMRPGDPSSIEGLRIPKSSDIASGIVKNGNSRFPAIMLHSVTSEFLILNLQNVAAGCKSIKALTPPDPALRGKIRLSAMPRSYLLGDGQ